MVYVVLIHDDDDGNLFNMEIMKGLFLLLMNVFTSGNMERDEIKRNFAIYEIMYI